MNKLSKNLISYLNINTPSGMGILFIIILVVILAPSFYGLEK